MGSERFYEKEMVSESDASYNSLSPDGSLTLSPGGSPKPKSSSLSDASSSPERLAELGIPSEIDEGVCTVGTTRSLEKRGVPLADEEFVEKRGVALADGGPRWSAIRSSDNLVTRQSRHRVGSVGVPHGVVGVTALSA